MYVCMYVYIYIYTGLVFGSLMVVLFRTLYVIDPVYLYYMCSSTSTYVEKRAPRSMVARIPIHLFAWSEDPLRESTLVAGTGT